MQDLIKAVEFSNKDRLRREKNIMVNLLELDSELQFTAQQFGHRLLLLTDELVANYIHNGNSTEGDTMIDVAGNGIRS